MPTKEEARERIRRRIHRMISTLDDNDLVFVYRLIGSTIRNQAKRKGGA